MHDRPDRLEALVAEVADPVRRYLARRTDAATADDVLGEVLVVLWRRLDEVPDPPLPWAYGVARGALANARRSQRRQRRLTGRLSTLRPVDDPARETHGPDADAERVRAALATLADGDAEVLRLWAWEDLEAREIAAVLAITPNAAAVRLHRARRRLAEVLGASTPGL